MKQVFKSKLLYKKYLTDELVLVGFEINKEFYFKAGQFFHIILDKNNPDDEKNGFRPFSILNSPRDADSRGVIESFIKLIPGGLASEYIKGLNINNDVLLRGPFGRFQLDKQNTKHVFLCTGTGITPVHSIIEQNINSENELLLMHSVRNKEELLYYEKFIEWKKNHKNFHYFPTLTNEYQEWNGLKGRINNHLHLLNDISDKTVYMCGVKEFIIDMLELTKSKAKNIIIERYN